MTDKIRTLHNKWWCGSIDNLPYHEAFGKALDEVCADRAALVAQIKEAQRQRDEAVRQRDEADATNTDTLAALGAAEVDAAIWKRRAERAEAAISSAVRELREQLQPNSTAARGDDSSTGEGRDSAPADGTR